MLFPMKEINYKCEAKNYKGNTKIPIVKVQYLNNVVLCN